ncbi:TPA: LptF/LptG family permease, partial [Neisseria gonorrhoeae]
TVSVLLLCLLAVPLSYFNPRSGHTYNILIAIGLFLIYQNGLTLLFEAVEDGKIHFWLGLLPMHIIMFVIAIVLLRVRSMPSQPFWQAVGKSLTLKGGK